MPCDILGDVCHPAWMVFVTQIEPSSIVAYVATMLASLSELPLPHPQVRGIRRVVFLLGVPLFGRSVVRSFVRL